MSEERVKDNDVASLISLSLPFPLCVATFYVDWVTDMSPSTTTLKDDGADPNLDEISCSDICRYLELIHYQNKNVPFCFFLFF